jgi:hypothetical protein
MNKGLQIFLLGLVFLTNVAIGFGVGKIMSFTEDVIPVEEYVEEAEPVVPEIILSTVPVILSDAVTAPARDAKGNFSFSAKAEVESGHQLKYVLYKDDECIELFSENLSGAFVDVLPVSSNTYYLRVQNIITGDWSEVLPIAGFVPLQMFTKITKAELENLINIQQDYTMAPKDFKHRIAPSLKLIVNGANENERAVSDIADICMKTFNGVWASVVVEGVEYDRQNRLQKLTIRVNY